MVDSYRKFVIKVLCFQVNDELKKEMKKTLLDYENGEFTYRKFSNKRTPSNKCTPSTKAPTWFSWCSAGHFLRFPYKTGKINFVFPLTGLKNLGLVGRDRVSRVSGKYSGGWLQKRLLKQLFCAPPWNPFDTEIPYFIFSYFWVKSFLETG